MKKTILLLVQYLFFLGLGCLFVWLTIKDISQSDWQHIKFSLRHARHWLIIPVLGMILLSHYSRALRWKILMEPLGYRVSTFNTFAAVMIGFLVNAGVPRLGEVVKCSVLARYEKVRADRLVGTIVVERVIDLICLLIVFGLALLFQGHVIGDFVQTGISKAFSNGSQQFSGYKLAIIAVILLGSVALFYFIVRRFGHIDLVARLNRFLQGIWHGLGSIRQIRHKGLFLFHTVLIWTMYWLSASAGIYALQESDHLGLGGGLTALAVGSVGMIITPGGIGAYPLLVAKLMELYGLDLKTTGTALGWLLWSTQTLIVVLGGVIFLSLLSYYNKRKPTVENRELHTP